MVYKLKSHSCKSFAIFFHLWSGGGPNWRKDHSLWLQEQDAEWHLVGSKSKKSYADVAKSSVKKTVFLRLSYPSNYASRFLEPPRRVFPSPYGPSIVRSAPKSFKRPQPSCPNGVQSWISKSNVRIQKAVSVVPQAPISNSNADPPPNPAIPNPACLKPLIECTNCLGLGHNRKFCQNLVRCRKCWNYGHTSFSCLNSLRERRKYRVVSCREGEESRRVGTYTGKALSLVPSATSASPSTPVHPKKPQSYNGELGL